jgi:thiamine kinase-like enzyme
MRHSMFKGSRSAFSDVFGVELEERLAPYLRPLPDQGLDMLRRLNQAPTTLLHCDLRLDNLFFRDDEVIFIDWQLVRRGPAVYDVAYFLSSALDQDAGRTVVEGLLEAYMEELRAGGVDGYTMDDLLRDYRLALQVVLMTLSTVDQVDLGDGRGIDLMRGWISRLHGRLTEMGEPG